MKIFQYKGSSLISWRQLRVTTEIFEQINITSINLIWYKYCDVIKGLPLIGCL